MNQTLRIIGGLYRGKKISFPDLPDLRPTPDRVRETLFNWLMHDIRGACCLDACAGSGALGFEAFSRGAAQVTLVEQAPIAAKHLQRVVNTFHSEGLTVLQANISDYLAHCSTSFDIIFFDPPFKEPHLLDSLSLLAEQPILRPGGLLYLETPNEVMLPEIFEKIKLKCTSQVTYALYRKRP